MNGRLPEGHIEELEDAQLRPTTKLLKTVPLLSDLDESESSVLEEEEEIERLEYVLALADDPAGSYEPGGASWLPGQAHEFGLIEECLRFEFSLRSCLTIVHLDLPGGD